jgi:CheY-like chemotaxis protein
MSSAHVLVIEDNPAIGEKLREVLERADFAVTLHECARAGLEALGRKRPDVVLTEHILPGVDGDRVADALRAVDADVPVVVMAESPRAQKRLIEQGPGFIQGFLLKPFRVPDLLCAVQQALTTREAPAGPSMDAHLIMTGELGETSMPSLLVGLLRSSSVGVLRLSKDGVERAVYVLNGLPVFAESNLVSETFGRYLLGREFIDAAQYSAVQQHVAAHRKREGEALVELGILNHNEIYGLLRAQVRERVIRSLDWPGAEFAFYEDAAFVDEKLAFPMNPLALVVEAVVRRRTPQALQAWFDEVRSETVFGTPLLSELSSYVDRLQRDPSPTGLIERGVDAGTFASELRLVETRAAAILEALQTVGLLRIGGPGPELTVAEAGAVIESLPVATVPDVSAQPTPAAELSVFEQGGEHIVDAEALIVDLEWLDDVRTPAADPLVEQVLARYLSTRGADLFAVLDVPRDADDAAIEAAFLDLSRAFHPDRFADHPDPEVRLRAKEVFVKGGQAFGVLSDPAARAAHRARLGVPAADAFNDRVEAQAALETGQTLLRRGEATRAVEAFERALAAEPGQPLFECWLARARFRAAQDDVARAEAEAAVVWALRRDPALVDGHLALAEIQGATGREADAEASRARAARLRARSVPGRATHAGGAGDG